MMQIKWAKTSRGLMVFIYHPNVWRWEKISARKGQQLIESGQAHSVSNGVWF